jgi:hypothetical protein
VINPNASASGDYYFYTEFDGSLDSWLYFLMNGKDEGFSLNTQDSKLRFDINNKNTWVYLYYNDYKYTDIRLDTKAENLGFNNNNVSLFCRYSDKGWYEFNVANNGKYWIYFYDDNIKDYKLLYGGASNAIRMGKDVNEYTAICSGNKLTLGINGVEVRTVSDNSLKDGLVGLSVSSFNVTPITVDFDYFSVSVP